MKNLKYIFPMIFGLIILASCRKTTQLKPTVTAIQLSRAVATDPCSNISNPFDTAGLNHNKILTAVRACEGFTNHLDATATSTCTMKYANQIGYVLPRTSTPFSVVVNDMGNDYKDVVGRNSNLQHVKGLVDTLIQLIKSAAGQKQVAFSSIKGQIESFEGAVLKNSNIPFSEKKAILIAASVARYSTYYWLTESPEGQALRFKNIVKWVAAITSDVAGAVVSCDGGYAAECSSYAYDLVVWSMPG